MPHLRLFARVPAHGRPAWCGPDRHPESVDRFNSVATLQHIARTLAIASFDGVLVDPPWRTDEAGAIDPWLCAMVLALAAPTLAVGFRNEPVRKAGTPDLAPLLGAQWLGDQPPVGPLLSVRVLVAANRWMAEDQLEYVLRRYPQTSPPRGLNASVQSPPAHRGRVRNRPEEDIPIVVGTPQEVADDLERLLAAHATRTASPTTLQAAPLNNAPDGESAPPAPHHQAPWTLELVPIHIPGSYESFVRMVVPQLRHRGLIGEHADSWRPTI